MPYFDKEDVILVTGASSGIGRGVAQLLNAQGATVVGIARNAERLAETKAGCAAPERFFAEVKDLAEDIAALPDYLKSLKDKYGKFRGLAYCAGIVQVEPLQALDCSHVEALFAVDYEAPLLCLKGFADKRVHIGKGAAAVFVSSIASKTCLAGNAAYAGAKAALTTAVTCAARELAKMGIRVNTVSPSDIETPMTAGIPGRLETIAKSYPLGVGKVEDVANLVAYLISDEAKWITTQNYIVDCGVV